MDVFTSAQKAVDEADRRFQAYRTKKTVKISDKTDDATAGLGLHRHASSIDGVSKGVGGIAEAVLPLVHVLRVVAKVHPFVEVAVNAFAIVVELNLKRRESDTKIDVLFASMRDTMATLQSLETIPSDSATHCDSNSEGQGHTTIRARLADLLHQTARDIKACANACDVYSKKRLLTKVLRSATWDDVFQRYVELFAQRRAAILLRIAVHNGEALDAAHARLKGIDDKVAELLRAVRASSESAEHLRLRGAIERVGGEAAVLCDDAALVEVLRADSRAALSGGGGEAETESDMLASVKAELVESTADAVERNFAVFERKFRLQEMRVVQEMERVVHHEGDRVIESVLDGPHRDIRNPEIQKIWIDSGWRARVKSRHFVSALYDHFRHSTGGMRADDFASTSYSSRSSTDSRLAAQLLTLGRLQRVTEAIDIDATGFVTVAAINRFTDARPEDWSLLQWILYWAVGWAPVMCGYRDKIETMISKMFALRKKIRTVDQEVLDIYLACVHRKAETLTRSFRDTSSTLPPSLSESFKKYTDGVETRLRKGLETVRYTIDARDTFSLIVGPGRIEESVLPTLSLLLERDLQIFKLCVTRYISPEELIAAWHNLHILFEAFDERYEHLQDAFAHHGSDPALVWKQYACGMLDYWHDSGKIWTLKNQEKEAFRSDDDKGEDGEVPDLAILNFPLATDHLYLPATTASSYEGPPIPERLRPILGVWHGFFFHDEGRPCATMYSLDFRPRGPQDLSGFISRGHAAHRGSEFVVDGTVDDEDGQPVYALWLRFVPSHYNTYNVYLRGTVDASIGHFAGRWGTTKHDMPFTFEFRRSSPETLVCRPSIEAFRTNRAAALWSYALTAVHTEVLQRLSSTRLLERRRRKRAEWEAYMAGDPIDGSELFRTTTYADACYYFAITLHRTVVHQCVCDHCSATITGARIMCLECGIDDTLDFCDKPECMQAVVKLEELPTPHLPSHDLAKLRALVLGRELGYVLKTSKAALSRARSILDKATAGADASSNQLASRLHGLFPQRKTSTSGATNRPTCIGCSKPVGYPCWFCFECDDEVFLCQPCDEVGGLDKNAHRASHGLVRCLRPVRSGGEGSLEARVESLEGAVLALGRRFDALETGLGERMTRMEELLCKIACGLPQARS